MKEYHGAHPVVILAVMVASLLVLPLFLGGQVNSYGVYSILQTFADYGPIALAVGMSMIMAEYDLSAAAVYGLGALLAVKLGVHSVVVGALAAVGVGLAGGLLQGTVMARLSMSSVGVTLGGLLTYTGITEIYSQNKTVPYPRFAVGLRLDQRLLSIFSIRSLIVLGIFAAVAACMYFTRLGPEVRSVGGDRRSSRISGVPVNRTLVGIMALGGMVAAFGGALDGYSVASAVPNVGFEPLVFATIAAVLGGVTLSGGRGGPVGIACGALSLATLEETLVVINAPPYVSSIVTGVLLILVTLATAPDVWKLPVIRDVSRWRARRAAAAALQTPAATARVSAEQ